MPAICKLIHLLFFVSGIIFIWLFFGCNDSQQSVNEKNIQQGFKLSKKYCGSCHLFTGPDLLNKVTWAEHVLPKMGNLIGFRRFASDYIAVSDSTNDLTLEEWRNIVRYYVSNAPEDLPAAKLSARNIEMQLSDFRVEMPHTGIKNPATTAMLVDAKDKNILFADGLSEYCYTLSGGSLQDSVKIGIGVSNLRNEDAGLLALSMGVLYPSDARLGKLAMVPRNSRKAITLMDSLRRPVHANYVDLNGDSLEDVVICEFGNTVGQLAWFRQKGHQKFSKHILRALPGAVRTEIFDFNRDGLPDIMALMAQGDEGIFIYYNTGGGSFKEERVLQFLPTYGSNYFELTDFNGDGFADIVASNGDNGDYPPILKPYHGIRIYLNNGRNQFSEKLFLPLHGVGKVIARDFDVDGDLDLASISYFPDYDKTPGESFIYWRNAGNLEFSPLSFAESTAGRWLTMDANDLDGDGDVDIVLGNASFSLGNIPAAYMKKWNAYSPSVLILRNQLR
jgi:FG-GAP-like repeat